MLSLASRLPHAVDVPTDVGRLWSHPGEELITRHLQHFGSWEPHVAHLLRANLGPGMAFLDIGANIGYFTILASTLVGPRGHVVAVEPDPDNGALLRANLWRHGCSNVTLLPIAAWDSFGHLWLRVGDPDNRAGNSVHLDYQPGDIGVPAAPLDGLLHERFDLIKTDAEGSDHVALRGARRLLSRCPLAVVEFWPRTVVGTDEPRQVLDSYRRLGRVFGMVSEKGDVEPATIAAVLECESDYVALALLRRTGHFSERLRLSRPLRLASARALGRAGRLRHVAAGYRQFAGRSNE